MKLMILNLPRSFSENDLAKLLKKYGNIKACNLVMDTQAGKSKGFGFVDMVQELDAKAAIKALHGSTIGERKIRVKIAD